MPNQDVTSFSGESIYREFEPEKWYKSSHGILVQKDGNRIQVKHVTQFCILRWVCNFFKQFGIDLSEKLSYQELIESKVYDSDPNSVYNRIKQFVKNNFPNNTPFNQDDIKQISAIIKENSPVQISVKQSLYQVQTSLNPKRPPDTPAQQVGKTSSTSSDPTTSLFFSKQEEEESFFEVRELPSQEQPPAPKQEEELFFDAPELPTEETHSLVIKKQVFELSSDEISREIAKYSGKKTTKEDVTDRLRKNALFNRKQQLDEQTQQQSKTTFPTVEPEEQLNNNFKITKNLQSAASTTQGRRSYNQDSFLMNPSTKMDVGNSTTTAAVYGVFDGHGEQGKKAAHYVRDHFIEIFQSVLPNHKTKKEEDQLFFSCKETMKILREKYLESMKGKELELEKGGTTTVVAMVINGYVWVLNVGDSRAILVNQDGVVCQASTDAKPTDPRFLKKAKKQGGYLEEESVYSIARIKPSGLATPRSLGFYAGESATHSIIVPNPKISRYPLEQFKGGHLVLACDGIWDVATSDQVGAVVHQEALAKKSLEEIALTVGQKAFLAESQDNLTVVVVKL